MAVVEGPSRDAVRRLAQYRPFDEGGHSLEAMLQDLLLAATAMNGGGFDDLVACQTGFRDLWGLEVELDELRTARDALCETGRLTRVRGGFALTEDARDKLEERATTSAENEADALSDWREALTSLRPDLTDDDFACLCKDLGDWLNRVIVRHGVEAALLLYPEDERAHKLFEEVDALGTAFLPRRTGLPGQIREEALRRFVRHATPAQRTFLANRMNTAFYLTVLTLDPAAKGLVQERAQGRRIYLDTNFLYAVLGKAPSREVSSAHRLIALTKELGIEVAVTPWTVEELRMSIQNARRNAQRLPLRREFAQVVLVGAGEKGYSAAFWRDYHRTGVRPQDWFDRAAHFEEDLKELEIRVIDEGCATIDQNEAHVDEYAGLLSRVLGLGRERHEEVLEHDAKHRLLIERLRGRGHISFSNARFWFLTQDNKLPRFARQMPDPDEEAPELAFCISSSSWVQIVRALTPRTEDFAETVVTLLTSPYVGYRPPLEPRAVREVVARMDTYEDASPELAIAVLEDTALVREIEDASDDEIEERVRAAYSAKTRDLQDTSSSESRGSRGAATGAGGG